LLESSRLAVEYDKWAVTVKEKEEVQTDASGAMINSALYREFLAEREEILRHKWLESEKAGYDVGFDRALIDWILKHRANWRKNRQKPQVVS
jgi:hypothetical protein